MQGSGRSVAFQEVLEVGKGYSVVHIVGEYEDLKLDALAQPVQLSENKGDSLKAWSVRHNPRCGVEHALDAP